MSRLFYVYTVHIDPSLPHPYEEAQFVEEGFNWRAFLFSAIWALYNRLWLFFAILICVSCLIIAFSWHGISVMGIIFIQFAWHLFVGYTGNDWLRAKFKSKGFITADIVTGDSLLRAEQRFFDRYFAARDNLAFVS